MCPVQSRGLLNRFADGDAGWQHAVPLFLDLLLEQLPGWHADHAGLVNTSSDAVALGRAGMLETVGGLIRLQFWNFMAEPPFGAVI